MTTNDQLVLVRPNGNIMRLDEYSVASDAIFEGIQLKDIETAMKRATILAIARPKRAGFLSLEIREGVFMHRMYLLKNAPFVVHESALSDGSIVTASKTSADYYAKVSELVAVDESGKFWQLHTNREIRRALEAKEGAFGAWRCEYSIGVATVLFSLCCLCFVVGDKLLQSALK